MGEGGTVLQLQRVKQMQGGKGLALKQQLLMKTTETVLLQLQARNLLEEQGVPPEQQLAVLVAKANEKALDCWIRVRDHQAITRWKQSKLSK